MSILTSQNLPVYRYKQTEGWVECSSPCPKYEIYNNQLEKLVDKWYKSLWQRFVYHAAKFNISTMESLNNTRRADIFLCSVDLDEQPKLGVPMDKVANGSTKYKPALRRCVFSSKVEAYAYVAMGVVHEHFDLIPFEDPDESCVDFRFQNVWDRNDVGQFYINHTYFNSTHFIELCKSLLYDDLTVEELDAFCEVFHNYDSRGYGTHAVESFRDILPHAQLNYRKIIEHREDEAGYWAPLPHDDDGPEFHFRYSGLPASSKAAFHVACEAVGYDNTYLIQRDTHPEITSSTLKRMCREAFFSSRETITILV